MTLDDTCKRYEDLSGKLSDVGRQLALAALGIVWLFKSGTGPTYTVPRQLLPVAAAAVLALAFDFLQYLYATALWGWYNRHMEVKLRLDREKEFSVRREVNWPTIACFWLKAASTLTAYVLLTRRVVPELWH